MVRMLRVIWLMTAVLGAGAEAQGVSMTGAGPITCGDYLEARKDETNAVQYWQWTVGFLAGYNLFAASKRIEPPSKATVLAYLDKSCVDRPLATVVQQAMFLIEDLGGRKMPPGLR